MSKKIYEINEFARQCGYFFNACIEQDFICNNGYNCRHPRQEETEINPETNKEVGKCFCWSCPLGFEADEEDFNDLNVDKNGWTEYEEMAFIIPYEEREGE